jgi:hypothetical protein
MATRLSVSGQLTLASTERLDRLLEEFEGLSTLVLGDIAAESDTTSLMQKGLLVRGAGLSTESPMASPCRAMRSTCSSRAWSDASANGAALVVSDWQTRVGPASLLPPEHPAHQERLDYVRRMLGSEEFYWTTLEAGEGAPLSEADCARWAC